MPASIEITVDSALVAEAFDRLEAAVKDLRPAMRNAGGLLEKETNENFRAQGRPPWQPLSQATILHRLMGTGGRSSVFRKDGGLKASARRKLEGGMAILQDTGDLRDSVQPHYPDALSVIIGSVKEYAAIHQFGGMAGRSRKVRIPRRQYIPIDAAGSLEPMAEKGVLDAILDHIARAL